MKYASKEALLNRIRDEHAALCGQLNAIPISRWREAGVWGDGWSIADLVSHLAEWQRLLLTWYSEGQRGTTPHLPAAGYKWNETPRLNRAIWARHRARSTKATRADFASGYRRIVRLVQGLTPTQLLEPGQFAWTGRLPLASYIGANTASHYRFASNVLRRDAARRGIEAGDGTRQPGPRGSHRTP